MRLFDSSAEYIEYLQTTLIPDLLESGRRSTAKDFEEAIYWITNRTTKPKISKAPSRVTKTKPRKQSEWQKYIANKNKQIKFKSGKRKGRLDLKKMGVAFRREQRKNKR